MNTYTKEIKNLKMNQAKLLKLKNSVNEKNALEIKQTR